MNEIEALREEIAKLRERVAVLESGARWQWPIPYVPAPVYMPAVPLRWEWTCNGTSDHFAVSQ